MKKLFAVLLLLIFLMIQGLSSCNLVTNPDPYAYNQVDVEPKFPAGEKAFNLYLQKHIPAALNADQSGIASFTVTKNGLLTDVKIVQSVDNVVDSEAIKAFQESTNWIPAKKNGKNVDVSCVLPFSFLKKTRDKFSY